MRSYDERRAEIDDLVSGLIDRHRDSGAASSPGATESRPSSAIGTGRGTPQDNQEPRPQTQSVSTQTLSTSPTSTFEQIPEPTRPRREVETYNRGVQTEALVDVAVGPDDQVDGQDATSLGKRGLNSPERERNDENIRASLRKEIEEELKATKNGPLTGDAIPASAQQRNLLRSLNYDELKAVTSSNDFLSFVERSSKVIERALDEDYDLLVDYTLAAGMNDGSDEENPYSRSSRKKSHSLRQTLQLYSEPHTRRRMISDLQFSAHFPELISASYTKNPSAPNEPSGLVLLWNSYAPSRPEYAFKAASDILSARFSPFHPNLIIGGCYSGQVCLWDTRSSGRTGAAVQKTPMSGSHLGHAHPIYSINIIGTPNAHNIITASTDGVVCSWSVDMLTQPQEYLGLETPPPAKTDDLAPTSLSFPNADPTFFLVGTEEGSIYPCHRYDRAGAKAGVDTRLAYRGHTAPVMSTQFHPAKGPVDLGDLLLTTSIDWSIKLWRIQGAANSSPAAIAAAAATAANGAPNGPTNRPQALGPILDIPRENLVYDAKWAPHRPSVFAAVTGAGELEVFDLNTDIEVPVAKAAPTRGKAGTLLNGLNKCAWEEKKGGVLATGGLDGVVSLFEVGRAMAGGLGEVSNEEWAGFKKWVNRVSSQGK